MPVEAERLRRLRAARAFVALVSSVATAVPVALVGLVAATGVRERQVDEALVGTVVVVFGVLFLVFGAFAWVMVRRTRTPDALGALLVAMFLGMAGVGLAFGVAYGVALGRLFWGWGNPAWLRWAIRSVVIASALQAALAGIGALREVVHLGLFGDAGAPERIVGVFRGDGGRR